jgi:hypothetical protein
MRSFTHPFLAPGAILRQQKFPGVGHLTSRLSLLCGRLSPARSLQGISQIRYSSVRGWNLQEVVSND